MSIMQSVKRDINILSLTNCRASFEEYFASVLEKKKFIDILFFYFLVVRKLQDFESPYLSLEALETPHRIVIRKK